MNGPPRRISGRSQQSLVLADYSERASEPRQRIYQRDTLSMQKTAAELHEEFEVKGFLGRGIINGISDLRAENQDWFSLAEDLNIALVETATAATGVVKTGNWEPEAVAVRILLRSCGSLEGAILMTE